MTEAYLLINCESGKAGTAAAALQNQAGVTSVKVVTGLHDLVVLVEGEDLNKLGAMIVEKVQAVPGVARTVTMVCVDV